MKKIYSRFHVLALAIFLTLVANTGGFAQCVLQGTIADPGCGGSNTTANVGGMQQWDLSSTIGADYTVTISAGNGGAGCGNGVYSVTPSSFTATSSTMQVNIEAGGLCCWSATNTSAVLTYSEIAYTNTTVNTNMCQGTTRGLTVSPTPLTPGTWSVINGTGTGTIAGTTFTAVSPGTVTIRYTKGNCNSDRAITIDASPTTPTVGANQSVCALTTTLTGNNITTGTGTWTQVSGPGTTTFSNNHAGNSTATVSLYGTYVFQWSSTNGTCTSTPAQMTVTYSQNPSTATIASSPLGYCATLTSGSLGGNTPGVGSGTWTQTGGPGTTTFSNPNSGSSTATASVVGSYIYTWTITNGACAPSAASVTVNYSANPTTATVGGPQNICGSLSSASLGGNAPLVGTGVWSQTSGPGTTTFLGSANSPNATANPSVYGTYVYTWTISNGSCTPSTASVTVNFYQTPTNATVSSPTLAVCGSLTSGSLGGNTPAAGTGTWSQTSGPGTTTFSNVNDPNATATTNVIGTYVYTWTISNGTCTPSQANVNVTFYSSPTTASAGPQQSLCGTLTSAPLGGNAPTIGTGAWSQTAGAGVTFFSSTTDPNATASVSVPGTYIFTWTITNGSCASSANDTVNYYGTPTTATVGSTQNLCGTLTSNSLGGNTPSVGTGAWSQIAGPGTSTFSNATSGSSTATASVPGSYTYQWTISNGICTPSTANINVNFIASPSGGSIPNTAYCSSIGSGGVQVVGVSNANQYTWALPAGLSGSSTGPSITVGGSIAGTYTVTVTPLNVLFGVTCTGNPITGTVKVLAQPVIDSVHAGSVSCFGGGNDTLVVYGHTANGNLFYSINGGATYPNSTGVFPNLTAGSYNIAVSDDSTCVTVYANNPVTVTSPPDIFLSIASFGNVRCNGDSSGFVNLSASGGTGAISFLWNNGATSQNITHLEAGTFTVTATDANGCTKSISQALTEPPVLGDSITSTNVSCYGANDATATFYVYGGSPPYTYLWSNGQSTPTITNLNGAVYTVTATDNNGCIATNSVNIINPLPLSMTLTVNNVSCFGSGNGQITANVTGGTGTYTYAWSPNVSTGPTVSNVGPGTYHVTVTDVNNCSVVDSATVTQPLSGLSVSSIVTPVKCTGDSNGQIELLASGGVGGYTYSWSNGQSLQIISGLPAGVLYTATVTDGNGCQVIHSDSLIDPTPIVSSVAGTSAICAGSGGGSATLTVSGGVPPYTFLWSDLETTQNISNLSGGTYRVIITDANGCTHSDSVVITQPLPLVASIATTNVSCNGAANGTITVTVSGGTGAYGYAWTPNVSSGPTVTNAGPGTYVVTVTDANGCTLVDSATITQPAAALTVTATVTDITCNNANDGSISTQVSGGSGSYTYSWSPGSATTPSISGLSANTYTVTVTDANGCTATASGTTTNPTPITSSVTGTNVTCAGSADGTATVATLSGGTAPYTFLWTTFDATQSISGLSGGLYRVIITDANGCEHRDSVFVTEPLPLTDNITSTNVNCNGASNGTITVNVSGGTGAYGYAWTPNVSAGPTVTNAGPGTYVVTVTDANGCTLVDSATITQPAAALTVTATVTDITCNNANDGSISTQVSGGSGSYTYLWSPGSATTPSISGLSANTYTVTVTDANGCTATASGTTTNPSAITSSVTGTNVTCAGSANGTATVATLSGGTAPYTFLWSNFDATQSISGLSGGLYHVIITDAHGCQHRDSVFITEPQPLVVTLSTSNVNCSGASNGTITANVTGGTGAYTYAWTPNVSSGPTVTNAGPGTYVVTVTDANGCSVVDSTVLTQPQALAVFVTVTDVVCYGDANGSVALNVTGGSGVYSYTWSPNVGSGPVVTNLAPGTYHFTVTDANGCTFADSAIVTQPASPIIITSVVHNVSCAGSHDGTILVVASGGTGSYTYQWSTGQNVQYITGLSASLLSLGTIYTVTVTDANGCTAVQRDTLRSPSPITSSIVATDVTCAGASNGSAALTVTGGRTPYSYLWSNISTNQNLTGVPGGLYTVIITDSSGCVHTDTIRINEPQPLQITFTSTNVACNGANNGSITATVTGGTGAYTYTWSPNVSSGPTVSNAAPGTYHLTVIDGNGCTTVDSVTITQPPTALAVTAYVSNMTCHNANDGSISTQVSGGSGSYTYSWSPGSATTPFINGLSANTYTVTVTDANGCTATASGTITNPSAITSSITHTDVSCAGAHDGTATLTVGGGTPPYNFQWSNLSANQNLSNASGGFYTVLITDSNGCQRTDTVTIQEPLPLQLTLTGTNINCNGANNGTITATVTGGSPAYTYTWSPNVSSGPTVTNAAPGTYHLTVSDTHGCSVVDSITITQPAAAISVTASVTDITCNNANDGSISTQVSGGSGSYTYLWSPGSATTPSISGLSANTYTVTVTDANGCTATASGTTTNPSAITSSVTGTNVTCAGSANGTATVATLSGGTAPYTFLWSNFDATQSISGLSGGLYHVIITDAHGCQHRDSTFVTEPQPLVATITTSNVGCSGGNSGTITISVTGGTGSYTYTWSPNVSSGPTASNLGAGTYYITVTDGNGCTLVDSATITQSASTLAVTAIVTDMTCHDANNGSISTLVSGGTGSYTYLWSPPSNATTPSISGLSAGNYTVTVTDAGGCTATASGTITNPSAITSTVTATNVSCNGNRNGTATVATVGGGTAPYTYLWSTFAGTQSIDSLSGGLYYVIITDAHGCEHRDSVFVTEPQPISAAANATQISCNNVNDGSITVVVTGGAGSPNFLWSPTEPNAATISGLSANTYSVTVTDANNCTATASATIINPAPLSVASVVINPRCNTANNGTVTLLVTGGTQQYSYNWSGALAGSGQSAINVAPGTYYVTVTDAHGCTATDSATVTAPAPIYVSAITSNVSCHGNSDGSIIVTGYGGVSPYSYQWYYDSLTGPLGPITKDLTQVPGGDYYLVITDVNGCSASYHAVIKEADSLKITLSETDLTCNGASNGSVLVSTTGGVTPYHFLWNNFSTDSFQNGIPAGNYGVVVTDSNGCQQTKSINVGQPTPITVGVTPVNPPCNGSATGSIALNANGGAGGFTYIWSTTPVQTTSVATGLTSGTYYVTVSDANGCSQVDSATLVAPQALVVNTATNNPTCSDGNNGFISLDVHSGTAPYTYNWSTTPVQTGNVASDLVGGTYIVTITDANGCQLLDTAVITAPQPIVINVGSMGSATCVSSADGYVIVNVTGGLAPYTYQLGSLVQNSDTFSNLSPGVYAVSVRDANGCQAVASWTIIAASSFTVDLTVDHSVILAGETIQLTATPTSDTTVTGYIWSTADSLDFSGCSDPNNCSSPTAAPTSNHTYVVQAVNARGCIATDTVSVSVSNQASAFMPTAFTPNGDGINDRLEFDILGARVLDVQIWDRWGEKVFSDPNQPNGITGTHGWDGTFRGQLVQYDSYTYQIDVTYSDGHHQTIAGTIVVMR